jgi:hypothetical protein|tara:strand:- start:258 stop:416 length:159 start_codon:yes stop_codon:yes gene_type:complete
MKGAERARNEFIFDKAMTKANATITRRKERDAAVVTTALATPRKCGKKSGNA